MAIRRIVIVRQLTDRRQGRATQRSLVRADASSPTQMHTGEDTLSSGFMDDPKEQDEKMVTYSGLVRLTALASSCASMR
jgi:hypothetical protein